MMNLGPPPPPPPPPFSTGPPAPAPKPPAEVPSKATPPTIAPPAALAGAMLKDKKPFTYTPGGINLAEIKSPRMQRRLQRNASLEGVRPSPLAQQPRPTSGITPTMPPHGMIQVLPVPGIGMAPLVKPQPKEPKEPLMPKRSVCGPPPPPPPFVVSGESSTDPSPCGTPLTTTDINAAVHSATPPTTPRTNSIPTILSSPLSNGPQCEGKYELLPLMATEPGPSPVPPPPPPPNTNKRFSLPSYSSCSISSKSEQEENISPPSTLSSSPPLERPASFTTLKVDLLSDSKSSQNESKQKIDSEPQQFQESHEKLNIKSHKEPPVTVHFQLSCPPNDKQISVQNDQPSPTKAKDLLQSNEPEERKLKEQSSDNLITAKIPLDMKELKTEPDKDIKLISSPEIIQIKTSCNMTKNTKKQEIEQSSVTKTPNDEEILRENKSKTELETKTENTSKPESKIYMSSNQHFNPSTTQNASPNNKLGKETVQSPKSFSHEACPTEDNNMSKFITKPLSPVKTTQQSSQTVRSVARMASPPSMTHKDKSVKYDRFVRQASLPADPTSPPKPPNTGFLYIPLVRPSDFSATGIKSSTPSSQSPRYSPTSGLIKAPMPWMCGVRKEGSPPPEFLAHAQKAQERLQRQRSLSQPDSRRTAFSKLQRHESLDNSFQSHLTDGSLLPNLYLPSDMTSGINSPQSFKNVTYPPNHSWKSINQNSLQQPYEQQQPTPQQPGPQHLGPQHLGPQHLGPQYLGPQQPGPQQPWRQQQQPWRQPQQRQQRPWQQQQQANQNIQPQSQPQQLADTHRPRERIIPIVMEDAIPNKIDSTRQPFSPHSQGLWTSSATPISMGTGGAFSPYEVQEKHQSSSNALEALQQMQQNLAKLNSGLQTAYPRAIHQQLHHNLSPSHPQFSAQSATQQNGNPSSAHHTVRSDPIQSKSFKVIAGAYDNHDSAGNLTQNAVPEPKKYTGSNIPSRSFRMLQAMTDTDDGPGPGPGESDL